MPRFRRRANLGAGGVARGVDTERRLAPADAGGRAGEGSALWAVALAVTAAAALVPLWVFRYPAIQDYPQHLLIARIVARAADPSFGYGAHFTASLRPAPYGAWYALTALLARLVGIDPAGRLVLSLYPLGLLLVALRRDPQGASRVRPWGRLLLFPLAFGPQFYLGTLNYLLSLPLLLSALQDLAAVGSLSRVGAGGERPSRAGVGHWVRHALKLVAIYSCHPFSILVHVVLGTLVVLLRLRRPGAWKALASPLLMALLFASWFEPGGMSGGFYWRPLGTTVAFLLGPFCGMQAPGSAEPAFVVVWLGILGLSLAAVRRAEGWGRRVSPMTVAMGAVFLGVLALPFGTGKFTYINLRLASLGYLFLALWIGRIPFRGRQGPAICLLTWALLALITLKQGRIAGEILEVEPLLRRIPENARLLPLIFDNDSPELEPIHFDPHLHDHFYYMLRSSGGLSPYLFQIPPIPVRYRPEARLPAPGPYTPWLFEPQKHGRFYDYVLTRGAPPVFLLSTGRGMSLVAASGPWSPFRVPGRGGAQAETAAEQ